MGGVRAARAEPMAPTLTADPSTRMPVGQLRYSRLIQTRAGTENSPISTLHRRFTTKPRIRQVIPAAGQDRLHASSGPFRALRVSR